ncbi:MAG: hypothetical protein KF801_10285, partial [Cryobacterium sp.]|nr:hypothetical protein [Cryobacterium sp.]
HSTLPSGLSDRAAYDKMLWYPLSTISALYSGIAQLHDGDEAKAFATLRGCGMFIAESATNTFLKLLMRVMTPSVFASKAPNIWTRDNRYGRMETELLGPREMAVHLRGVADYAHVGPVVAGFGSFAMGAVGAKDLDVKVSPWSLADSSPPDVRIVMTWS